MNDNIVSLRQFIDRRDEFENVKIQTFCRLMKKVSEAIDKEERMHHKSHHNIKQDNNHGRGN